MFVLFKCLKTSSIINIFFDILTIVFHQSSSSMHDVYLCVRDYYHPTRKKEKIYIAKRMYRAQLLFIHHRNQYFWAVQKFFSHTNIVSEIIGPEMIIVSLLTQEEFKHHFVLSSAHSPNIPPFYLGMK